MQEAPTPKRTSQEYIEKFIDGRDPQERIVNLLYTYKDDFVSVVYRNKDDVKMIKKEPFKPFCWATLEACHKLFNGDRNETFKQMTKYKIGAKRLSQKNVNGEIRHEFDDGYLVMFYAQERMSYSRFLSFFKKAGNPIYSDDSDPNSRQRSRQYLCVTPQEQFLISTGKRFFKGYDDYDEVLKMTFDLETENLDTENGRITKIGIRMNRPFPGWPDGFKKIINVVGNTDEEKNESELWAIEQMLKMIYTFKPDIIAAHNGESFDWNYIIGACKRLGHPLEELSAKYFGGEGIRKDTRETVLKLGGEIETFHQTIVPRIITVDSLHAVRRAQAIDSNMKRADLKYVTEYSDLKLPNRVYVPGKLIAKTDAIKEEIFAFNDENGDWYRYDPEKKGEDPNMTWDVGQKKYIPVHGFIKEGYILKSGKYIVDRYLQDDLYECDKVEHRYNTPNFLICKMLPVPYKKCTTMGTAGQWKSMMLAWSYENGLAIPMFGESKTFTGGLSRLLRTGFVKKVIKLDYNSLYPSIILTWGITDPTDLMLAMLHLLEHVLTQREKYKKLKKVAGNKKKSATNDEDKRKFAAEESFNDKKQLPLKIFGNSFFGSYGAPNVFPWGSLRCAEQTTCTGRMALRLMISHFHKLGYEPIVGDSVTGDTPLFIRYVKTGEIDIKPICELIDASSLLKDAFGREYDTSEKPYQVLCRSGWVTPTYIYRHKTGKDIYKVDDGVSSVEVTQDHSLYDKNRNTITPENVTENTEFEYFDGEISGTGVKSSDYPEESALKLAFGSIDRVPVSILNGTDEDKFRFYSTFMRNVEDTVNYTKVCLAGIMFISAKR